MHLSYHWFVHISSLGVLRQEGGDRADPKLLTLLGALLRGEREKRGGCRLFFRVDNFNSSKVYH